MPAPYLLWHWQLTKTTPHLRQHQIDDPVVSVGLGRDPALSLDTKSCQSNQYTLYKTAFVAKNEAYIQAT